MFNKKKKKSAEELKQEREDRIRATAERLRVQILKMDEKKNILLRQVTIARQKGLKAQEQQARGLLGRCLASQKRANGMLMTLELAVQSRDLAELNYQFLQCIGDLSDDIEVSSDKSDVKKTEKKYTKALYKAGQQTQQIDEMLEVGDYAASASVGSEDYSEFDEEIDSLIADVEAGVNPVGSNRQKY